MPTPLPSLCTLGHIVVLGILLIGLQGCNESSLAGVDRRVDAMLSETSADLGPPDQAPAPSIEVAGVRFGRGPEITAKWLPTENPTVQELIRPPRDEAIDVLNRLQQYRQMPEDALRMDLPAALSYATRSSREFQFAEESYMLAALQLLTQQHIWGPRFFDEVTASIDGFGNQGTFDTALQLVNEFRVTQRLPYGGEVSARALVAATQDLNQRVAGEDVQSAAIILRADVPLLRGAGLVAQEDLIQASRDLIYGARSFERFRREFCFEISRDFLDLVVRMQGITNSERQVQDLEEIERRELALVDAGRQPPFEAALAAQDKLFAIDRLNSQLEQFRLAVDRFKVRIGMPSEMPLIIDPTELDLPLPPLDMDESVRVALDYRLDLQNTRDQVDDSQRQVNNAMNDLEADLDLFASVTIPTDRDLDHAGLQFDAGDTEFTTGITYGLPLDRQNERYQLRETQIALERAIRSYEEFRDTIAVQVRTALRQIDRSTFSLQLQDQNIEIAKLRRASIEAAPDRASARDRSDAVEQYLRALDDRDAAQRDVQVAILAYLLETGQFRVDPDGQLLPTIAE